MGKYEVFTPEMEYPEGMTDEQAFAVYKVYEMRRFACELEHQLENPDVYGWAEDAIEKIEEGEVTVLEILERVMESWMCEEEDFETKFSNALDRLV